MERAWRRARLAGLPRGGGPSCRMASPDRSAADHGSSPSGLERRAEYTGLLVAGQLLEQAARVGARPEPDDPVVGPREATTLAVAADAHGIGPSPGAPRSSGRASGTGNRSPRPQRVHLRRRCTSSRRRGKRRAKTPKNRDRPRRRPSCRRPARRAGLSSSPGRRTRIGPVDRNGRQIIGRPTDHCDTTCACSGSEAGGYHDGSPCLSGRRIQVRIGLMTLAAGSAIGIFRPSITNEPVESTPTASRYV